MTRIAIASIMRPGSRDRDPCEIKKERRKDDDEQPDRGDGDGSGRPLPLTCQQAFYSRDEVCRGRVPCDPAARVGERGGRDLALALASREDERGRDERDLA